MERFGIITTHVTHVPGDERSISNPGHGYPAHSITNQVITEYANRHEWEVAITRLANPTYGNPEKFRAIIFQEVEVTREIKIKINDR